MHATKISYNAGGIELRGNTARVQVSIAMICSANSRARDMKIDNVAYRSVWVDPQDGWTVRIFDQTRLPWSIDVLRLSTADEVAHAIRTMQVRGAPLIGAVAAYGLALALREDASDTAMEREAAMLAETRPTAINLRWAIGRMLARLRGVAPHSRVQAAYDEAAAICDEDVAQNEAIGCNGLSLLSEIAARRGNRVDVLTHCNAGWIATVDWGTALAPIYMAHDQGIDVHVWVDETRPRNQGALLTAWELGRHGVPHTVIADNAGGHLMQHGKVDAVIVGTDRVTRQGDVANKIGTYLKALAAHDNGVPFWVALPSTTIDWTIGDGVREIEIEERNADEVGAITGPLVGPGDVDREGEVRTIRLVPPGSRAANPAFDVTPARLVSGLITERGVCAASEAGLLSLFPERRQTAA
jgi:methylthioribose-1-phosphate isomerase